MTAIPIRALDWIKLLFANPAIDNDIDTARDSSKHKMELLSIYDGTEYVSKSLMYLADKNVISSCRIHREFGKLKRPFKKTNLDDRDIYLSYLWEGAEKVIETARHISTNPNHSFDTDIKSEIKVLAKSIEDLGSMCKDKQIDDLRAKVSSERDFIRYTIAVRSKNMRHEHFNDGTLQYAYLTLLYHLHSFLNAASRLDIFRFN